MPTSRKLIRSLVLPILLSSTFLLSTGELLAAPVDARAVLVLVHGVNADKEAYEQFKAKIHGHLPDVHLIEFDWGKELFFRASDSVGGRANSLAGMSDDCFVAVAKLKDVVAQCRELVGPMCQSTYWHIVRGRSYHCVRYRRDESR